MNARLMSLVSLLLLTSACSAAEIELHIKGLAPGDKISKVEVLSEVHGPRHWDGYATISTQWTMVPSSGWRLSADGAILYVSAEIIRKSRDEQLRISVQGRSSKSTMLSLSGAAPYPVVFAPPKPKLTDLQKRGVDPLLAPLASYDDQKRVVRVPGYTQVNGVTVNGDELVWPYESRFLPALLSVNVTGNNSELISSFTIQGKRASITVGATSTLSQALVSLCTAGESIQDVVKSGVTVYPNIPREYQRFLKCPGAQFGPESLTASADNRVSLALEPVSLMVRMQDSNDVDRNPQPTFQMDAGPNHRLINVPSERCENGRWKITPGSAKLITVPTKVVVQFGPSMAEQIIDLQTFDWTEGVTIKSPTVKGWALPAKLVVPSGTLFRVSVPNTANVWLASFDHQAHVLHLPAGKTWEEVKGAFIEVRPPGGAPAMLSRVERPVLELPDSFPPEIHKTTVVVLNNLASVVAASPSSENRIRQLQSEIIRKLVASIGKSELHCLTAMRGQDGTGNSPPSASNLNILPDGDLPFGQVGSATNSGLAHTLRSIVESTPSSNLHVVVVTPYCSEEKVYPDTQWLKTSLKQLNTSLTVHTAVIDARVQISEDSLNEVYVNPICARASSGINLFDETDRVVNTVCQRLGIQFKN